MLIDTGLSSNNCLDYIYKLGFLRVSVLVIFVEKVIECRVYVFITRRKMCCFIHLNTDAGLCSIRIHTEDNYSSKRVFVLLCIA